MKKSDTIKILFLYTELAGYFLNCVKHLIEKDNTEVHIVRWPVNKEAPFGFEFGSKLKIYERNNYGEKELLKLVNGISPDLIYCAGWMDRAYLEICKKKHGSIPIVLGFDNKWEGTIKQQLSVIYARSTFINYFSHCFIPGKPQLSFAERLGFKNEKILRGVYCADVSYFNELYTRYKTSKEKSFPKKFVFVGRYNEAKDISTLWNTFMEIQNEQPNEWELWCLGTGDVKPIVHPKIKHIGFVQPSEIGSYIGETGVFILPSKFEPWGVVVHEFAAAGFPLICSDSVGAVSAFLENETNGFVFETGNKNELKDCMKKMMSRADDALLEMGKKSVELSKRITPVKWSEILLSVLNKK